MRFIVTLLITALCAGMLYAQAPQNIKVTRYVFPHDVKITGMALTKKSSTPKQVWFTERDSFKIGTMIFPKAVCAIDSTMDYLVDPIKPFKIAYAEKAPSVSDKAQKPLKSAKYSLPVWFIDYNPSFLLGGGPSRDSIYALAPRTKKTTTGTLIAFPSWGGQIGVNYPTTIQWTAPAKRNPAPIWFTAYSIDGQDEVDGLYSLAPNVKLAGPFGAQLTHYTYPGDAVLICGMHVENGFVWFVAINRQTSASYLYMMPVAGGEGLRWLLNINPQIFVTGLVGTIQPLYSSSKPKAGVLPNQVWINATSSLTIVSLNPSLSPSSVDSTCTVSTQGGISQTGLFSDNGSGILPGKSMCDITMNFDVETWQPYPSVEFMQAHPSASVQREAVTFTNVTAAVNGNSRTVPTTTTRLETICRSIVPSLTSVDCITSNWQAPFPASTHAPYFLPFDFWHIDMSGMANKKQFDIVFSEIGGLLGPGLLITGEPAITRVTGKYPKAGAAAGEADPDYSFAEETPETEVADFMLDDAYPNPFNPTTTIQFALPAQSIVTLKVYDMLGQEVATLANGTSMAEGIHKVDFNASQLPSGVYFYRMTANDGSRTFSQVKKIILTK